MTNADKKMVPELRFKGYTDDWDQRKLRDILVVNSGKDYKHLQKGDIPVYGTGGYMLSVNEYLSNIDGIGLGRKGTINKPQFLNAPFWTVDTLFYLLAADDNEINFIYYLVQKINWKKYDESTGVPSLSKKTIEIISQNIPNKHEQIRIAKLLNKLDDYITLHQSKLEKLKELKNGLLQQMFPQKDEKVPKLRFANFEGDWETKKFKEIWRRTSNKNKDLKYDESKIISVAKMTDIFKQNNTNEEYLKTYNILKKGDIAFEGNKSKNYLFGRFVLNDFRDGIVSHVFITFTPIVEMDDSFMKEYINNDMIMKYHLVKSTTKTIMMTTLIVNDMNERKLVIPIINEQEKIGGFLLKLDNLISLEEQELDKLQLLKKSLLQKMFI